MTKSNKYSESKNNTTEKENPTKKNSKEANRKVTGDENETNNTTKATKTICTTTANEQGMVIRSAGAGSSTVSISVEHAYKEMKRFLILIFLEIFENGAFK